MHAWLLDGKSALHGLPTTMEHLVSISSRLAPQWWDVLCMYQTWLVDGKSALHGLPTTMEHLVSVIGNGGTSCVCIKHGFYFPGS